MQELLNFIKKAPANYVGAFCKENKKTSFFAQ
jgi:hypothetical protein